MALLLWATVVCGATEGSGGGGTVCHQGPFPSEVHTAFGMLFMDWEVVFPNLVCSGSPGAPSLKLSFKTLFLHPSGQVVLSKEVQQILPILEKKLSKKQKSPKANSRFQIVYHSCWIRNSWKFHTDVLVNAFRAKGHMFLVAYMAIISPIRNDRG